MNRTVREIRMLQQPSRHSEGASRRNRPPADEASDDLTILCGDHASDAAWFGRPQHEPVPGRIDGTFAPQSRAHPGEGRIGDQTHCGRSKWLARKPALHGGNDVTAVQGAYISGFDGVNHIADREDTRT